MESVCERTGWPHAHAAYAIQALFQMLAKSSHTDKRLKKRINKAARE